MEERLTLKAITQKKKNMNWGEIPPFFHMVSNTLSDLEGISVHGFDNAFRRIIKKTTEPESPQGERYWWRGFAPQA